MYLYRRNWIRVRAVCTEFHWIYEYKRNNIKTILRDRLGKDTMGNPKIISQKDLYANAYYIPIPILCFSSVVSLVYIIVQN